jgi:hypothetical protein
MAAQQAPGPPSSKNGASSGSAGVPNAGPERAARSAKPRPRERATSGQPQTVRTEPEAKVTNSIRPTRRPKKGAEVPAPEARRAAAERRSAPASASPAPEATRIVPEEVRQRFMQVRNKFYFEDGTRAFTDRGSRLTTRSENTEVIRSLITIAQARGWNEITVRGTERFRKEAWFAARIAGLEVRGYKPSEFEQSHLIRTFAREREEKRAPRSEHRSDDRRPENSASSAPAKRGSLLTGQLLDFGYAPYLHNPHEPMSYFVKIETGQGDRVIWGIDLERALKQSLTKPQIGDEVGLRAVKQAPVTVRAQKRDDAGKVVGEKELATHRNQWILEKRDFFTARAEAARTLRDTAVDPQQAVKRHPELVGSYLQVHAAELAARQFPDAQDRVTFIQKVRSALAASVARGEPLPPVRMRERSAERPPGRSPKSREPEPSIVRG